MNKFFQDIVDYNLFADWAKTLDWLCDDNKFKKEDGWTSGYVGALTKKIKKLPQFSEGDTYQYGAIKSLAFPNKACTKATAIFSNGSSESKDFVRHIRNGIAHGNTSCFKNSTELFIEIYDYDGPGGKQTAYMCFPLSYIVRTHNLYCEVKKSHDKNKKKPDALHNKGK